MEEMRIFILLDTDKKYKKTFTFQYEMNKFVSQGWVSLFEVKKVEELNSKETLYSLVSKTGAIHGYYVDVLLQEGNK